MEKKLKALKPLHKNDPRNTAGQLPDILSAAFSVKQDLNQRHRYFVLAELEGDLGLMIVCVTSTSYSNFNKMLAEMIVDGLESLKNESS